MDPAIQPVTELSASTSPQSHAAGPDLTGQILGDYVILRRLGQGGMGQVFLAEQISLKRKVALKLLRPDMAADTVSLQRFKAEAEAVARATHANIVQVYAIGEANGLHFMALEYVEGRNLREYIEKKGPPELLVALSIMRQVAAALQRANELSIIHRDIKPENILLTRKGEAKVADFGLSRCFADGAQALKLTQTGVAMGTPLYMSPEQVEGKPVDPRTDIYSFGVTCFYMFTGRPPFLGETALAVALQHLQNEPPSLSAIRPDLPASLCAMIHKMMAKLPEQRYQTGREIVRDIASLRDACVGVKTGQESRLMLTTSTPARTAGSEREIASGRARPWLRVVVVSSIILGIATGGLLGWLRTPSQAATTGAADEKNQEPPLAEPSRPAHRERAELLRTEWARYVNPGNNQQNVRWGLNYAIELGLLYLDERKLDEADRWFHEVETTGKHVAYRLLGKMGKAIVLAFQDRDGPSNFLFRSIVPQKQRAPNQPVDAERSWFNYLVNQRQLRRALGMALDHNFDNSPKTFPAALERFRHPPGGGSRPQE